MKEDLPRGAKRGAIRLLTGVTQDLLDLRDQAKATNLQAAHILSGAGSTMMDALVTSPWVWPPTERGIRGGTGTLRKGPGGSG